MYKIIYIIILIFLNIFQIKTATIAKIDKNNSEIKYNNQHYLNSYKIPSTMALYKSNGKFYDEHPLMHLMVILVHIGNLLIPKKTHF